MVRKFKSDYAVNKSARKTPNELVPNSNFRFQAVYFNRPRYPFAAIMIQFWYKKKLVAWTTATMKDLQEQYEALLELKKKNRHLLEKAVKKARKEKEEKKEKRDISGD